MRHLLPLFVVGAMAIGSAAHAGFVMLVDDPSTAIVDLRIEDGGAADALADIPGVIGYFGEVGGLLVNATAQSKDVIGSDSSPRMKLSYEGGLKDGSVAGSLDIVLTDTGFRAGRPSGSVSYDGLTDGTLQLGFFGSSSNEEFAPEFVIATSGGPVTGGFSESLDVTTQTLGSLTVRARIGFDGTAQTGLIRAEVSLDAEYVPGDVNGDGQVNGLDVDPFAETLLNGPYQAAADMNEDQVVNGLDVDPFVAAVVGGGTLQPVPEASTFALAVIGILGIASLWRKRSRAAS